MNSGSLCSALVQPPRQWSMDIILNHMCSSRILILCIAFISTFLVDLKLGGTSELLNNLDGNQCYGFSVSTAASRGI